MILCLILQTFLGLAAIVGGIYHLTDILQSISYFRPLTWAICWWFVEQRGHFRCWNTTWGNQLLKTTFCSTPSSFLIYFYHLICSAMTLYQNIACFPMPWTYYNLFPICQRLGNVTCTSRGYRRNSFEDIVDNAKFQSSTLLDSWSFLVHVTIM